MIDLEVLRRVSETMAARKEASPDASYVSSLYAKGTDAICKKVAEESAELIMAAKDGDLREIVAEATDVWFHTLVLLHHFGLSIEDIGAEFRRREGVSGISEKNARTAAGGKG